MMDDKLQSLSDSFSKSLSNTFLTMLEERVTEQILTAIGQELQKINLLETIRYYVNDNIQPMMRDAILQSIKGQMSKVDPQFKQGSIDNIKEAISDIKNLNITEDSALDELVRMVDSVIPNDGDVIRESETEKESAKEACQLSIEAIEEMTADLLG
jgi:hypothetical protein